MANRQETQRMLDLTCAMWDDPLVYMYQNADLPPKNMPSIFLAGPSSRQDILEYKWRAFAVHYLRKARFKGIIYVPEPRENDWSFKETFKGSIVEWEKERLLSVTVALVWLCRHQLQLPGRVTGVELAFLVGMAYAQPDKFKERVFFGHPLDAWKVKSDVHWARAAGIQPVHDLETICISSCERAHSLICS